VPSVKTQSRVASSLANTSALSVPGDFTPPNARWPGTDKPGPWYGGAAYGILITRRTILLEFVCLKLKLTANYSQCHWSLVQACSRLSHYAKTGKGITPTQITLLLCSVLNGVKGGKCRQCVNQIIVTDHNETKSLPFMQRNLRHIREGDMMHYRPSIRHFWRRRVPPVPRGIYTTACEVQLCKRPAARLSTGERRRIFYCHLYKKSRPQYLAEGV